MNGEREKGFSNLLFRWMLDKERTRLIFCTVPDTRGRNVWRFQNTLMHFPRWVEKGFELELMRLTDFVNSLPISKRKRLSGLANLDLMRPSQTLINDLWAIATERMPLAHFYQKRIRGTSRCL